MEEGSACKLCMPLYQENSGFWTVLTLTQHSYKKKPIAGDIFIVPPPEAHTTKLWKLQKCVYSLNDAARKWYFAMYKELEKLGCHRSSIDYGVFFWYYDNQLSGLFQSHVDDFLWAAIK